MIDVKTLSLKVFANFYIEITNLQNIFKIGLSYVPLFFTKVL